MANPEHVKIVKQGAEAIQTWQTERMGEPFDLTEADMRGVDLALADLRGARLSRAKLQNTRLDHAQLQGADLAEANIQGATFFEAQMAEAVLAHVRKAEKAHFLETVNLSVGDSVTRDVRYFKTCIRPWPERRVDWEWLRNLGRLPLFGASYTALILIPVVFSGIALYNSQVERMRTWATPLAALPDHPFHWLALLVREHLLVKALPSLSLVLLVSTVLLAIASTLYALCCPSRVKEFSRDQWCDQLGRSLLHYWPLSWKYRWIRLTCAACYTLGGAGALWVIGDKVWKTAVFIWKHSVLPWPWQ